MTTAPTPKADQLRAMREAKFGARAQTVKQVQAIRERVAAIPAKKPKQPKRGRP